MRKNDLDNLYQRVFGNEAGQAVLEDLKEELFYERPCNSPEEEGQRRALLYILDRLNGR